MRDLSQAEAVIGYTFRDRKLLETALTHASFVHEHGGESYERLEFLGDSILNFAVSEALFRTMRDDEGKLTVLRAQTVSQVPLAHAVKRMGLIEFVRMGAGAVHDEVSDKFVSNLFESIVGAIYIDSGSLEPCRKFIFEHLTAETDDDYKTKLQEAVQAERTDVLPEYRSTQEADESFSCTVYIAGERYGTGTGNKKKRAEQAAAAKALEKWRANRK